MASHVREQKGGRVPGEQSIHRLMADILVRWHFYVGNIMYDVVDGRAFPAMEVCDPEPSSIGKETNLTPNTSTLLNA